jgi:hypothetical protein
VNLYLNGNYNPPKPTIVQTVGSFKSLGCRRDPVTPRLLTPGTFVDTSGLTVQACIAKAAGFKYAAVEFGSECFWGNTLATSDTSGSCDTPCSGSATQLCGGGGAAILYENEAYVPPAPVPTVVPNFGTFDSKGCFADSTSSRLLTKGSYTDSALTLEKCINRAGYARYIALENANQCFWGNVLTSTAGSNGCNKACTGQAKDVCGGSNAASLYENSAWVPTWTNADVKAFVKEVQGLLNDFRAAVQDWKSQMEAPTRRIMRRSPASALVVVQRIGSNLSM